MVNRLHALKIVINGHPLFRDSTEFSFVVNQRVAESGSEDLTHLFGSIYVNNLTAIIGRNASGKTMTMRLVIGVLQLLLEKISIPQTRLQEALFSNNTISFDSYFYSDDKTLFKDHLELKMGSSSTNDWQITSESIFSRHAKSSESRHSIFEFQDRDLEISRNQLNQNESSLLAPDDSLMRSIIAKHKLNVPTIFDTLALTDVNIMLYGSENVPNALLEYLDPSVDSLQIEHTEDRHTFYRLKFKGNSHEIVESNFATISKYLSSGTAKAITLYQMLLGALRTGGIVFVDEIENHFHKEIVKNFLEFFANKQINKKQASIVFSTHYAGLIDTLSRGDQVYVIRRHDQIQVDRYSELVPRADSKRSELFTSTYLTGTAPEYDAYMALRRSTIQEVINGR
ncbi:ATP-binding protein [Lacticaseibacillus pabuli]|uniref:ATP-binding protein n=1 Tax=Lacticaseibacillus pabuli TaxID=3025672 RepID=A0ABY7WWN5_9LACO|nr:ATP-binding protein [Lacticaseibacillus sp. KACC 23028]WDF82345.1 ATP-binding protein [Lacticaseibacillus sp. KACC 23028]